MAQEKLGAVSVSELPPNTNELASVEWKAGESVVTAELEGRGNK